MKWWLTRGNVRLCWPPSAKVPKWWQTFGSKRSRCEPKFWAREREFHRRLDDFSKRFKVEATFAQTFPMWQLIEPKYYEGGHCQSVLRSHRFFYIHPLMSGRWHRHLTWSCEPQENILPCAWWGNPPPPPPPDTLQALLISCQEIYSIRPENAILFFRFVCIKTALIRHRHSPVRYCLMMGLIEAL